MIAPACRDCRGTGIGDVGGDGAARDCERCQGGGVEVCLECPVGAPSARVVAAYADTCADGSPYESQVCAACARRLVGLIETPSPCRSCNYVQVMPGWGYLEAATGPGAACVHLTGERECPSCSERWYFDGAQSTHDYEFVGDPARYVGGPAKELCPACVAADESEAAAGEPRVTQVYLQSEPPSAADALAVVLAMFACPLPDDQYLALVTYDARGGRT